MRSLITTVYGDDKDAIYRVDSSNNKTFYASLYKGDAAILPKKITFCFDDFRKCRFTPENISLLVVQFKRAIRQLHWHLR